MARELVILTPEKTILSLPIASLGTRIGAHVIDIFVFIAVVFAILMLLGMLQFAVGSAALPIDAIMPPLFSLGPFVYFILLETFWNGKTPGKAAFNLRVQMADGTPVTARAAITRNLLRPADLLPATYFVGLITMFLNPKSQRLGDLAGNTIVVVNRMPNPTFKALPHAKGYHQLEEWVGDLRGMTREDYNVLHNLTERYYQLPTSISSRLMREVWMPISQRIGIVDIPGVPEIQVVEAVVMRYGRIHGLL